MRYIKELFKELVQELIKVILYTAVILSMTSWTLCNLQIQHFDSNGNITGYNNIIQCITYKTIMREIK